jgi:hypothetical protein
MLTFVVAYSGGDGDVGQVLALIYITTSWLIPIVSLAD